MAWYQWAKDKATIRDLEEELARRREQYAELVAAISDALARLRQGAVEDTIRLLDTQYQRHHLKLEDWRTREQ